MEKYLEDKCCKELQHNHIKMVNVVTEVYNKLLCICKDQMAYFAVNVLNVSVELLDDSKWDAAKIIGFQTVTRFIYNQVDGTYGYNIENLATKRLLSVVSYSFHLSHVEQSLRKELE